VKKLISILVIMLIFSLQKSNACDICGCGVGGSGLGILPQFNRNFVGLRYKNMTFQHQETPLSYIHESKVIKDQFQTAEIWARIYANKRWQFMFFAPFSYHQRIESQTTENIHGIGDISAIAYYLPINTSDSIFQKTKITWMVGGGIQLPTGKYQQRNRNLSMYPAAFQIGSGAWTMNASSILIYRINNWGINNELSYRYFLENEILYQFGAATNISLSVFRQVKIKNHSFIFSTGLNYEKFEQDKAYGIKKEVTGGQNALSASSIDFYFNNWMIGVNYQTPIWNKLPSEMPFNNQRIAFQLIRVL